jgi:hypothetical protein
MMMIVVEQSAGFFAEEIEAAGETLPNCHTVRYESDIA